MKAITAVFVTALLLGLGCATSSDNSQGRASERFGVYKTFAILPVVVDSKLQRSLATAVTEAAEDAARSGLQARGYAETNRENADLVLYLHGKSMAPVALTDLRYQPTPTEFGISHEEMESTASHRIFVEAYENKSRRQVWMGWTDCWCKGVGARKIRHEVGRVLEPFPN